MKEINKLNNMFINTKLHLFEIKSLKKKKILK